MTPSSCPFCGQPVPEGSAACPHCGQPLPGAEPAAPPAETTAPETAPSLEDAAPAAENAAPSQGPSSPVPQDAPAPETAPSPEGAAPAAEDAAPSQEPSSPIPQGAPAPAGPVPPPPADAALFAPPPPPLPPPPPPGPRYAPQTPQEPDGGLSTAQYFWALFLFAVPVLGLILMVYWSFGSTTCPARQRLARASLIKTGVLGVLAAIALACAFAVAVVFGRSLLYAAEDYLYDAYGYYDYYDAYPHGDFVL